MKYLYFAQCIPKEPEKSAFGLGQSPYNRRSQMGAYCTNTHPFAKPAVVDSRELSLKPKNRFFRFFGYITWVILFFFSSLSAEIIEIKKIEQCNKHIQPDMLLVFDIDNTLMETAQTLGSDQWFSYRIEENIKRGMLKREAAMVALAEWVSIQNKTKVKLVEPVTAAFVEKLQKNGWKVVGLTSRGLELAAKTIEQLKSIGIDFTKAAPASREIIFDDDRFYRDGILFCSGTNKGSLLFQFFNQVGCQPKKILFVDDKEKYLREVEKDCLQHQIPFLGIRYGFLDEKIKNFKPQVANEEWKCFGNLIGDDEAELHLK